MLNDHFKDSARVVAGLLEDRGITADVYQILNLTDALIKGEHNFTAPRTPDQNHETLVQVALDTHEVIAEIAAGRRIYAIKALRAVSHCSLKEAVTAVEDDRVKVAANLYSDPWSNPNNHVERGDGEPPF